MKIRNDATRFNSICHLDKGGASRGEDVPSGRSFPLVGEQMWIRRGILSVFCRNTLRGKGNAMISPIADNRPTSPTVGLHPRKMDNFPDEAFSNSAYICDINRYQYQIISNRA